jgi:hypothetical protein
MSDLILVSIVAAASAVVTVLATATAYVMKHRIVKCVSCCIDSDCVETSAEE